ncbi:nucleotide exchange factor GrpE [Desulfonema magnum]|uniref:Protein GrpE n=1 Tax=Desulfonema magnum TaxID=45655 RepID=A0A975BIN7_9BACT|nr:nucleotide exchange factor GrpE [Desulfonema magnum]QTA86015.1 HSP70 cofactor GrpE domain-containing protein [Desulfonema magnum]
MYLLFTVIEWCRRFYRQVSVDFMRWNIRFFSRKMQKRLNGYQYQNLPDWKLKALEDFKFWLEDIPNTRPAGENADMDSCDLYTLLSEFSALRQEIRIQNREQNKAVETLNSFIGTYQEIWQVFKDRSEDISELEERIRQSSEKRAIIPFLNVRDTLVRGLKAGKELADATEELAKSKGLFRSVPKGMDEITAGMEGIIEGYEMAIRRFDRALELANIYPVDTVGEPFDPKTMKAVGKQSDPETEEGLVIEEQLSGFVRDDEIIRTAEVIVNT